MKLSGAEFPRLDGNKCGNNRDGGDCKERAPLIPGWTHFEKWTSSATWIIPRKTVKWQMVSQSRRKPPPPPPLRNTQCKMEENAHLPAYSPRSVTARYRAREKKQRHVTATVQEICCAQKCACAGKRQTFRAPCRTGSACYSSTTNFLPLSAIPFCSSHLPAHIPDISFDSSDTSWVFSPDTFVRGQLPLTLGNVNWRSDISFARGQRILDFTPTEKDFLHDWIPHMKFSTFHWCKVS